VKMKAAVQLLAFCAVCASGSAFGQQLYPVQGPATAKVPPPRITASPHGSYAGKISVAEEGGESFQGKWSSTVASFANVKAAGSPASFPPQPNLAFAWDAVFGQGYFVANVLGYGIGQATLTGDHGTVLQLEFLNTRFGVAVDNKGNIYKMVW
jgi:hypothetical protein